MNYMRNTILLFCILLGFGQIVNGQWSVEGDQICTSSPNGFGGTNKNCKAPSSSAEVSAIENKKTTAQMQTLNQNFNKLLETLNALNQQVKANTEAMQKLKDDMEKQNKTYNLELQKIITSRFASLPADLLNNELIKARLEELKKQILEDIKKAETEQPKLQED